MLGNSVMQSAASSSAAIEPFSSVEEDPNYVEDDSYHVRQYDGAPAPPQSPAASRGRNMSTLFMPARRESSPGQPNRGSCGKCGGSLKARHRGSVEQGRRGHLTKAAVRAVGNQVATGRCTYGDEPGKARMTAVRKSQRDLFSTSTAERVPKTYRDTMKINGVREAVLNDARRLSPISAVLHANKLKNSIVPRLFSYVIVWIVVGIYAGCATLARLRDRYGEFFGGDPFGDAGMREGAYEGASVLVTFMVVFYLGYCYSRYFEQYAALRDAMATIVNVMLTARVCLPTDYCKMTYMYLNLLHATAYVGMTPVFNSFNFLDRFITEHDLADDEDVEHRLAMLDIDHAGAYTFNVITGWTISLFHEAQVVCRWSTCPCTPSMLATPRHPSQPCNDIRCPQIPPSARAQVRGDLDGETYRNMHHDLLTVRSRLNSLYAYQHQVIPFVYSHLVSLACFLYLAFFAVEKVHRGPLQRASSILPLPPHQLLLPFEQGARFTPESTYLFGLFVPGASFFIALVPQPFTKASNPFLRTRTLTHTSFMMILLPGDDAGACGDWRSDLRPFWRRRSRRLCCCFIPRSHRQTHLSHCFLRTPRGAT